jgi:hypothetical protein
MALKVTVAVTITEEDEGWTRTYKKPFIVYQQSAEEIIDATQDFAIGLDGAPGLPLDDE